MLRKKTKNKYQNITCSYLYMVRLPVFYFLFHTFLYSRIFYNEHDSFFGQEKVFKHYMQNISLHNELPQRCSYVGCSPHISILIAFLWRKKANRIFYIVCVQSTLSPHTHYLFHQDFFGGEGGSKRKKNMSKVFKICI